MTWRILPRVDIKRPRSKELIALLTKMVNNEYYPGEYSLRRGNSTVDPVFKIAINRGLVKYFRRPYGRSLCGNGLLQRNILQITPKGREFLNRNR